MDASRSEADAPLSTTIIVAPLSLEPPFSTSVHDYYVRCAAGDNTLTVSMTAASGSTIALLQPTTTPASTGATATIAVTEDEAMVVGVSRGGVTDPYWIRCLPHNFPRLQMTRHPEAGTPTPGYYLVGDVVTAPGETGYAAVLDANGVPVWYHTTRTGRGPVDVDSVIPGTISFVPFLDYTFRMVSGQFELHDLLTGGTTYVEPPDSPLDSHELRYLPNGDYLVLSDPIERGVNLTGLGFGPSEDMVGCQVQELDPSGAAVWTWRMVDHFDPVLVSTYPETTRVGAATVIIPFHCNSVDVDPDGNLLVSARDTDSIFLVSRATGTVEWKIGGTASSSDPDTTFVRVVGDPLTSFYRQHDVRFLQDGTISMFDDQTGTSGPARAVIYSFDVNTGTATVVWQYLATVSSDAMGSFRVSPDGSRLVGYGVGGARGLAFTEVDERGDDLLDFSFPDGDASYRAVKVPSASFDIALLRASAGAD